jgi:hypothetical protein
MSLTMLRLTFTKPLRTLLMLVTAVALYGNSAQAQFTLTSLVTTTKDPNLKNSWGITYLPGGAFWISDENTGLSTVYDANGTIVPLVVTVPTGATGKGSPTGIAANSTTGFVVTQNGVSAGVVHLRHAGWHHQRLELLCKRHLGGDRRQQSRHRKLYRAGDWDFGNANVALRRQSGDQ